MRGTRTIALAGVSALALLTAACNGGDGDPTTGAPSGTAAEGQTGGEISVVGCTPQNPFIPAMTNETCGGDMLDLVLARLVHYNSETAAPELDVAEAIDTTDNQNFTVKIKPGYKFTDGSEIKAKNFVDAWNWNRAGKNGTLNSYFFDVIEGAADMDCGLTKNKEGVEEADCEKKPASTEELSGLKLVDDYTFTIKTTEKVSNLPVRLGYSAFAPLPDSFFEDDGKAYGALPVGGGPYKMESYDPATGSVLVKNPDYAGTFAGKADKITFKIYQDQDAAYKDIQAGQTDLQTPLPVSALQGEAYKTALPDRFAEKPTGNIATVHFPSPESGDKSYDNPDIRKAISMAIDRPSIIKAILAGTREPATGWVSPIVDGYKAGACGDSCTYDPAKAKALLDQAGGYKGTITLGYNADGDHKGWSEAACNTIGEALGVECKAVAYPDFATFRGLITDRKMKGMFRTGWQMDYPSIENFLAPLYGTGAGSNDGDYSSEKFDSLLKEAAAAEDAATANAKYQEAEAVLGEDLPVIPMWYGKAIAGWSDRVDNVKITPFGTIDLAAVTVKS